MLTNCTSGIGKTTSLTDMESIFGEIMVPKPCSGKPTTFTEVNGTGGCGMAWERSFIQMALSLMVGIASLLRFFVPYISDIMRIYHCI